MSRRTCGYAWRAAHAARDPPAAGGGAETTRRASAERLRDRLALAGIGQPAAAAGEIVLEMRELAGGRDDAGDRRVRGDEFQRQLPPAGSVDVSGPGGEGLALERARELGVRTHGVMSDTDIADAAGFLPGVERFQLRVEIEQVVHLDEIEALAPEQLRRVRHLLDAAALAARPHLGGEKRALAHGSGQQLPEHALGARVHGRGVDEARAGREEPVQHLGEPRALAARIANLKGPGGTESDDGNLLAARGDAAHDELRDVGAGGSLRHGGGAQKTDGGAQKPAAVHSCAAAAPPDSAAIQRCTRCAAYASGCSSRVLAGVVTSSTVPLGSEK